MAGPIRVGIVGGNHERGWARDAHVPALRALPQFTLAAVSARTQERADAAAAAFGAERAYGDSLELVRDPGIDLVTVTVKVPEHRAIVLGALAAGKHVYCEWPLGVDLAQARELAAAVPAKVHAVVGLQGLSTPEIRHAVGLLRGGIVGRPLSARVFGTAGVWGDKAFPHYAYLQDRTNGATLETITGGHAIAALEAMVGRYVELDARASILRTSVKVAGTDEVVDRTCADHLLVLGRHAGGCVSTLEIAGGVSDKAPYFEVVGTDGWLRVAGTGPNSAYQLNPLVIEASVEVPPVPPPAAGPEVGGPVVSVAEAYARLAADLANETSTLPDFEAAVALARLLEAIDDASDTGQRQRL